MEILDDDGNTKKVTIQRAHLEADAAKIKMVNGEQLIDLNRYGVALLEIVSDPCMSSPLEVENYLKELISISRALGVSRANMEDGNIRADINMSVRPVGEKNFRTRMEIKNMVSFKFIKTAIEYEAARQIDLYENGETFEQSTMHFDEEKGTTSVARLKENAADYGYVPDPDAPVVIITDDEIEAIRKTLPEFPRAKMERFIRDFALTNYDAKMMTGEKEVAEFFESAVDASKHKNGKSICNLMMTELFAWLNKTGLGISESFISAAQVGEISDLVIDNKISVKIAKDLFKLFAEDSSVSGKKISGLIEEKGWTQVSDTGAIDAAIDAVIAENPDKWEEIKSGKDKLMGWFVGQVMSGMHGKGNPAMINECLSKKLKS